MLIRLKARVVQNCKKSVSVPSSLPPDNVCVNSVARRWVKTKLGWSKHLARVSCYSRFPSLIRSVFRHAWYLGTRSKNLSVQYCIRTAHCPSRKRLINLPVTAELFPTTRKSEIVITEGTVLSFRPTVTSICVIIRPRQPEGFSYFRWQIISVQWWQGKYFLPLYLHFPWSLTFCHRLESF